MKIEIRSDDCAVISGYVNAVERRSKVLRRPGAPPFREIVKSGTFRKALETGGIVSLMLNHERTLCDTSGGLELREDNVGLYASAAVTDPETIKAAREGRLTGWSFGFCCLHDSWRKDDDGLELRELDTIRLDEVSILTKSRITFFRRKKNMNKLKEKRNRLYEQVTQLVQTAENETRSLTEEETASYQSMIAEIRSLDEQINRAEEVRNLALDKSGKPAPDASGSDREQAERRAFESFLTGRENRDAVPVNMTYGTNGAVIPTSIMNKVIDRVKEISPIFAAATKYPVKGQITIPKIDRSSGDITVAFAAEFAELTANGFKFSSITLSPHLAGCLVKLSKQLINNSQIDVVSVVIDKMAESIAAFIEGFLLILGYR